MPTVPRFGRLAPVSANVDVAVSLLAPLSGLIVARAGRRSFPMTGDPRVTIAGFVAPVSRNPNHVPAGLRWDRLRHRRGRHWSLAVDVDVGGCGIRISVAPVLRSATVLVVTDGTACDCSGGRANRSTAGRVSAAAIIANDRTCNCSESGTAGGAALGVVRCTRTSRNKTGSECRDNDHGLRWGSGLHGDRIVASQKTPVPRGAAREGRT